MNRRWWLKVGLASGLGFTGLALVIPFASGRLARWASEAAHELLAAIEDALDVELGEEAA